MTKATKTNDAPQATEPRDTLAFRALKAAVADLNRGAEERDSLTPELLAKFDALTAATNECEAATSIAYQFHGGVPTDTSAAILDAKRYVKFNRGHEQHKVELGGETMTVARPFIESPSNRRTITKMGVQLGAKIDEAIRLAIGRENRIHQEQAAIDYALSFWSEHPITKHLLAGIEAMLTREDVIPWSVIDRVADSLGSTADALRRRNEDTMPAFPGVQVVLKIISDRVKKSAPRAA